jgi:hypothetical protein
MDRADGLFLRDIESFANQYNLAVECDGPCGKWFHRECIGVDTSEFNVLKSSKCKLAWFCISCNKQLEEWKTDRDRGKEMYVETITEELGKAKEPPQRNQESLMAKLEAVETTLKTIEMSNVRSRPRSSVIITKRENYGGKTDKQVVNENTDNKKRNTKLPKQNTNAEGNPKNTTNKAHNNNAATKMHNRNDEDRYEEQETLTEVVRRKLQRSKHIPGTNENTATIKSGQHGYTKENYIGTTRRKSLPK